MPDLAEFAEKPRYLNLLALLLLIPAGIYLVRVGMGLSAALAVLGAAQALAMTMDRPKLDLGISGALLVWTLAAALWGLSLALQGAGIWPFVILAIFSAAPAACAGLAFKTLRARA